MKKYVVIKVGGAFLENQDAIQHFFKVIIQLQQQHNVVIVHGGGALVQETLTRLGISSRKYNGLRITPDEDMPYVTGALAGTANKSLVASAIQQGIISVGVSIADGGIAWCDELDPSLHAVGAPKANNPTLITILSDAGFLPIISSIGVNQQGRLFNVNADDAATCVAQMLNATLILLSDVDGVLDAEKNLVRQLTFPLAAKMIDKHIITDGMAVKVKAAQASAAQVNSPILIAGWKNPTALLDILSDDLVGTWVHPAKHSSINTHTSEAS